jgi:hypothetical protein
VNSLRESPDGVSGKSRSRRRIAKRRSSESRAGGGGRVNNSRAIFPRRPTGAGQHVWRCMSRKKLFAHASDATRGTTPVRDPLTPIALSRLNARHPRRGTRAMHRAPFLLCCLPTGGGGRGEGGEKKRTKREKGRKKEPPGVKHAGDAITGASARAGN